MNQKRLSLCLKLIIAGCAICGIMLFIFLLPMWLFSLEENGAPYAPVPWIVFMWFLSVPCFLVLACGSRIAIEIGKDNSFSRINARMLKYIAVLAIGDSAVLLLGNVIFLVLGINRPLIVLISAFVCFAGLAISMAAGCLSQLVLKAAILQEESELTI